MKPSLIYTAAAILVATTLLAKEVPAALPVTNSVPAGKISGSVLDSEGKSVAGATVVLCDHKTGTPLDGKTLLPCTDPIMYMTPDGLAAVITDTKGRFEFKNVPNGRYRLIAQSWKGKLSALNILDTNSKEILLHGVAENISLPSPEATNIKIVPLGTGTVVLDENFPNDDSLLVISTEPLSTDLILGFISWQGSFLQNLIGANRMPSGFTQISGLPAGTIYLSVFAADSAGGFGAGQVEAKPGETITAEYIQIVCSWSNGRHTPPAELEETFTELKTITSTQGHSIIAFIDQLLEEAGVVVKKNATSRNPLARYYPHLNQIVSLPSGRDVRFADVLASLQYIQLEKMVEKRNVTPSKKQTHSPEKTGVATTAKLKKEPPNTQQVASMQPKTMSSATPDFNIQTAIDNASSGDTLVIPAGTYTQPITIDKEIILDGSGAVLKIEANQPAIQIDTRKPVVLKNLEVEYQIKTKPQQGEFPYAVYASGGDLSIQDCSFLALGTSEKSPCAILATERSSLHIQNCSFDGFNFTVQIWDESEGVVEDSLFTRPGHCGITIGGDSTGTLRRNIVTGSHYHGIRCTGGEIIADSNLLIANRNRGFYIGNKSAIGKLSNNLIIDNATGINVLANSKLDIVNNVIVSCSYAGLAIADTSTLSVENNIIANNERGVIGFTAEKGETPSIKLRGENVVYGNTTQTEGIKLPSELIGVDPQFEDADSGLFAAGASDAKGMGLTDPAALKTLWMKWKEKQ